jgi:ComF family protein
MRTVWNDLLHLFFPRLCLLCKSPLIEAEEQICLECFCDLPYVSFHPQAGNPVSMLFAGKIPFVSATAFLQYGKGGKVQRLAHAFKYHGNKKLACQLGRQAGIFLQSEITRPPVDYLIPVPLHPKRERKRGYNQSEWICRGLASVLPVPIHSTAIQRRVQTRTQTRKTLHERWLNMQNVFVLNEAEALRGRHVLLVDDVCTSGSTLLACAETLLAVPGIRISILALACAGR